MEAKKKLVESLYRAIDIIILENNAENISEVLIRMKDNKCHMSIKTESYEPLILNESLPRDYRKNIKLRSKSKNQNKGKFHQ